LLPGHLQLGGIASGLLLGLLGELQGRGRTAAGLGHLCFGLPPGVGELSAELGHLGLGGVGPAGLLLGLVLAVGELLPGHLQLGGIASGLLLGLLGELQGRGRTAAELGHLRLGLPPALRLGLGSTFGGCHRGGRDGERFVDGLRPLKPRLCCCYSAAELCRWQCHGGLRVGL
ncbi:hypothetical protein, partial [Kitasatospora sp. NPDC001527]|uniref:hypothetical protein n=1 Tax=Kitasatospora sp. NPDC001527 TaxID=3154519 RepID=UPI0033289F21